MKILDLLANETEEKVFTERKLPQYILDELTADFDKPKLVRISKKELYTLLQSNPEALLPYANLLNHWTAQDDDQLQTELQELLNKQNVNYVDIEKAQDKANKQSSDTTDDTATTPTSCDNDEQLTQLMEQHLEQHRSNAEYGNTLYELGMSYYDLSQHSKSVDMGNRIASIFLSLAAQLGHIEAQLQLGKQYLLGYGVETNYKSAIYHFVRSGASGSVEARTYLGVMYMQGYGVKKSIYRAYVLLNESSRFMNPTAQRYLAELYEKGYTDVAEEDQEFEIEQDYYIALRLAEKACTAGQSKLSDDLNRKMYDDKFVMEAATICGRMYCVHLNDFEQGIKYFEIAADLHDVDAQCNLGHIYWVGIPGKVKPNIYKSVSYLLNAANKGHKRAHRELGMIYSYTNDNDEIENLSEGVLWLDLAGKEGYLDCYFRLAEIYAAGNNKYTGVKQDFKVAKKYLEMTREESDLSKNVRDKLPENIWNLLLANPLQTVNFLESYENAIGGKWRGQYLSDLDPAKYQLASHK